MKNLLEKVTAGKRVLILGFGREGKSSYRLLRKFFPEKCLLIADKNIELNLDDFSEVSTDQLFLGDNYLDAIKAADVVFKSPGIEFDGKISEFGNIKIVSQTSLFLEKFHRQIIGVTGTKGKSTTSSLIFHLLNEAGQDAVLVGNIGVPPFDALDRINNKTRIVFEVSAHQLEFVSTSPHVSVLLNIFQEHLDYFESMENYAGAKFNIARYQTSNDRFIFDIGNEYLKRHFDEMNFSGQLMPIELSQHFYHPEKNQLTLPGCFRPVNVTKSPLHGHHNLKNILFAAIVCNLSGLSSEEIEAGLATFKPLEHRLEFAGVAAGITFYNDSISTIPEATIEAVRALANTDTLILGGKDRGIDYSALIDFLASSSIMNFMFTGPAGKRMMTMLENKIVTGKNLIWVSNWSDLPALILHHTKKGSICLLSPAASSYDRFVNFEERGKVFKKMVEDMTRF